jgi:hypothetical protein
MTIGHGDSLCSPLRDETKANPSIRQIVIQDDAVGAVGVDHVERSGRCVRFSRFEYCI